MDRSLGTLRVLIVDDNHHMVTIIKAILRGFGLKDLFDATDVATGFGIFQTAQVDLIITDFAMEPDDGCTFTKLVRTAADSPNHFVPVLMLTAYAERGRVEKARDVGVTEFCAKPVTPTELYRKICAIINTPRPFVRTSIYFGPDRRRRKAGDFTGVERRET